MEFDYSEAVQGAEFARDLAGTAVRRSFNVIAIDEQPALIRFSDHYLGFEQILPLRLSNQTLLEFSSKLQEQGFQFDAALVTAFSKEFGATPETARMYAYQEGAIERILGNCATVRIRESDLGAHGGGQNRKLRRSFIAVLH